MKLEKPSNQLIDNIRTNERNFVTRDQVSNKKTILENQIKMFLEEKEKIINNTGIEFKTRIEKLKEKDKKIQALKNQLKEFESKPVSFFYLEETNKKLFCVSFFKKIVKFNLIKESSVLYSKSWKTKSIYSEW